MRKIFQFKSEIGWSELISGLAAVVAFVALYQSYAANSPSITISALPPRAHHVCNDISKEWNVVAVAPFQITNIGGRTTTLIGISRDGESPPFMAILDEGETVDVWHSLLIPDSIALHPQGIDAPSWDVERMLDNSRLLQLDVDRASRSHPTVFDIKVPAGETVLVSLGIRAATSTSEHEIPRGNMIRLSADFSHGRKIPVQAVVERPFVGRNLPACR
jgi:hypothetical protein